MCYLFKKKTTKQINSTHMSIRYIPMSWKSNTPQSAPHLLRIWIYSNGKLTTQLYDKWDDFNFSIVNFPYSNFACIWCLYVAADLVCKSLFDIRSVFNSKQSTDYSVDVTGVSTLSFKGSCQKNRYNDLVCQDNLPLGQMLSDVFHTLCTNP
jgi:hypothetical protein